MIWSVRFSAPDLSTVQKSLRTTSIFSIGLITVLVASNSPPAGATDGKTLLSTVTAKGRTLARLAMARRGKADPRQAIHGLHFLTLLDGLVEEMRDAQGVREVRADDQGKRIEAFRLP